MIIRYTADSVHWNSTPCPHGKGEPAAGPVMVNSWTCHRCKHFVTIDKKLKAIDCSYGEVRDGQIRSDRSR